MSVPSRIVPVIILALLPLTANPASAASGSPTFGPHQKPVRFLSHRSAAPIPFFPVQLFANSFDAQPIGPIVTGGNANDFSGTKGGRNLTIENTYTNSAPNALSVNVVAGGSGYVYKTFGSYYPTIQVAFSMAVGKDFTVGPGGYVGIASTETYTSVTRAGLFELTVNPGGQLGITYYDGTATQHYIWTNVALQPGNGYDVVMQQVFGAAGSLAVFINGVQIVNAQNINWDGVPGALLWNIGNVWAAPATVPISGHLFFDDISTAANTLIQSSHRS